MKDMTKKEQNKAFTLLEVLLAITIFSLVVVSLYATFRVGLRAYASGQREIDRMQHSRVLFESLSRDLRSVYYAPETSYNTNLRRALTRFQEEMMKAEMEGRLDEFLYGVEGDPNNPAARNPYEVGLEIDLHFKGDNSEGLDRLSFVRYQYDDGISPIQPWSLSRVEYFVEDDTLYRTEADIIQPMKDLEGVEIEEKFPRKDPLAKGVRKFDIQYGFFYQEDWMMAEDWDSSARQYRNPKQELDEEDPDYPAKLKRESLKPEDGLPAFVQITMDIVEPDKRKSAGKNSQGKKRGSTLSFTTLVRIPTAQENYLPSLEEDDEDE
jgi:prepilin-type N-terminal cleavage/methylation domain-containing protein